MPYDLAFERIAELPNEAAFELNKAVAAQLIIAFPEIYDLNPIGSSAHFMQRGFGDLEDEFPEKHFSLYAEVKNMHFGFQFWKNTLWLELGAGGSIDCRFALVRSYAAFITQQGFKIYTDSNNEAVTLDEGIASHLCEYQEWVGLVERVTKLIATTPPTTN